MRWRKRMGITGVVLVVYVLSFGPADRLTGMAAASEDGSLTMGQEAMMVVYFPVAMASLWVPPFEQFLEWYVQLWGAAPGAGPSKPGPSGG